MSLFDCLDRCSLGLCTSSWSEVESKVRRLGLALFDFAGDRLAFGSGAPIGVFLGTSLEFALIDAACNSRGWSVAPLYETFASDALAHILNLVDSHVVVTNPKLLPRLIAIKDRLPGLTHVVVAKVQNATDISDLAAARSAGLTVIGWAELIERGSSLAASEPLPADGKWWFPVTPDSVQTYCATSGTTGMPKIAVITHGNWMAAVAGGEEVFGEFLKPRDAYISYLPMAHVFEKVGVLRARQVLNLKHPWGQSDMYHCFRFGCAMGLYSGEATKIFEDMEALKPKWV